MPASSINFSVIIPTYHRDADLAHCLDRLAPGAQTLDPARYEVIVTDAGTRTTAEAMLREKYPWARWIHAPGKGPGANRNHGARAAQGEWLVFVDDDCLPDRGWLAVIHTASAEAGVEVVEGRTEIPDCRDHPLYYAPRNPHGGLLWSCNLAIRRASFERLGGFDEDLVEQCEDMEFAARIHRSGMGRSFAHDALVLHPMRRIGWRGVWRQTLRNRWHLLYALKTGGSPPLDTSTPVVVVKLAAKLFLNLLRTTAHLVTRHHPHEWRTKWFTQAWSLVTFPFALPYLICWELRFRELLRNRT
jgi:GT2 family glycosyltransferase